MRYLLFAAILFIASCTLDVGLLYGHWQASAFYENGQTAKAQTEAVSLEFSADGRYLFRSSAYYSEAGTFRESGNFLYLTDTTATPSKVRKIKVLYLSNDTLKIKMGKDGKEQVLFLYRQSGQ